MNGPLLVCGALVGLGLFLIIRTLRPAPPRMAALLAQMEGHSLHPPIPEDAQGLFASAGPWLAARLAGPGRIPIPRRELDLIGMSVERFLINKLACLIVGLWIPVSTNLISGQMGDGFSWLLTGGAALGMGAVLFLAPDLSVRADAAKRRAEFKRSLTSYLDWVALQRAAGAHPNQALEAAAAISDTWAFLRIRTALERARNAQIPLWEALADLGEQIGVDDLTDLADIAALAGDEGAKILDTLVAKAESLRSADLADARAAAGSSTTTMVIPIALLALGFLSLLAFPVVYRLAGV